jgi:hypothetical protein
LQRWIVCFGISLWETAVIRELPAFSVYLIILFTALTILSIFSLRPARVMTFLAIGLTVVASLMGYIGFLYAFAGFPAARPSFGAESDWKIGLLLLSIFVCVLLGTVAEYFFGLGEGTFSWRKMLTPLSVSPLVMLPLIGSLPNVEQITILQWVSLGFLGFQNGFFWRRVFEKVATG